MLILILGLIVFFGVHSLTMARETRASLIARWGEGPYKGLYALASAIGLALIIWGYGRYRAGGSIPVWSPPIFTRHLALTLMWFALVAVAAAYIPGRIKATLKHPMLVGVKIWAVAHLLAKGDLGSILLFGSFLIWAGIDRASIGRRQAVRGHGGPVASPAGWRNDIAALAVGTVVYGLFLFGLHRFLIGVSVLP